MTASAALAPTAAQMSVRQSEAAKTASGFVVRQDNPEMLRERAEKWHKQSKAAEAASGFWIQAAHNITKVLMKHLEAWHTVNQSKAAETRLRVGVIKSLIQHLKHAKEAHLWTLLCLQQHYRASGQQKHALANMGVASKCGETLVSRVVVLAGWCFLGL